MKITTTVISIAVLLMTSACNNTTGNSENVESATTTEAPAKDTTPFQAIDTTKLATGAMYYQCSMDPEVITVKPVDCPKCGMKLDMKHKK